MQASTDIKKICLTNKQTKFIIPNLTPKSIKYKNNKLQKYDHNLTDFLRKFWKLHYNIIYVV